MLFNGHKSFNSSNMDIRIRVHLLIVMLLVSLLSESKNLGGVCVFDSIDVDSVVVTLVSDTNQCRLSRHSFSDPAELKDMSECTIYDKVIINKLVSGLMSCDMDSVLPYTSNQIVCKIFDIQENKISWHAMDDLDIRCRCIIFVKNKYFIIWISRDGVMDLEKYRCYDAKPLLDLIKTLF